MAKQASKPAAKARNQERFTCLDIAFAFKNDDKLKTNTALQIDAAKIEFEVM